MRPWRPGRRGARPVPDPLTRAVEGERSWIWSKLFLSSWLLPFGGHGPCNLPQLWVALRMVEQGAPPTRISKQDAPKSQWPRASERGGLTLPPPQTPASRHLSPQILEPLALAYRGSWSTPPTPPAGLSSPPDSLPSGHITQHQFPAEEIRNQVPAATYWPPRFLQGPGAESGHGARALASDPRCGRCKGPEAKGKARTAC